MTATPNREPKKLKHLLGRSSTVIFLLHVKDRVARLVFMEGDCARLLGCSAADIGDDWLQGRLHPDDATLLLPDYDALASQAQIENLYRVHHGSEYRWLRQSCRLYEPGAPQDYLIAGTLTDGDAQHRLLESARRYQDFTKLSSDWYWEQDACFRFTYFSKEFEEITSITLTGILGKTRWDGLGIADYEGVDWEGHKQILFEHKPFRDFEYPSRFRTERSIWFRVSGFPKFDEQGVFLGYIGIASEIGAYKEIQEEMKRINADQKALIQRLNQAQNQMLQSEKMASIGQLAAGVAHEINNPVGFIKSNFASLQCYFQDLLQLVQQYEVMEDRLAEGQAYAAVQREESRIDLDFLREDVPALLSECRDGLERVRKIVRDLLDFSHEGNLVLEQVDLHAGLESTLNVAANEINSKADVVRRYGDLPLVECYASQLNQVFLNLLVNAAQAIEGPQRGVITVSTHIEGSHVSIEVCDTGAGIAPEHLGRIFDPFFTTKPVGQGTGLGLSVSYGVIEKHHGRMEVSSEPGKGTSFRVYLPVRQPAPG